MKGEPIFRVCFKAHEQGFETVQPEVRAFSSRAHPIQLRIQIGVFGLFAFAGTGIQGTVSFDAAPETVVA